MTTQNVDTSNVAEHPLVGNGDSQAYAQYELLIPGVATLGSDSVASVTVNTAGSGFVAIPIVGFSGGGGSGAAAFASMKSLTATTSVSGTGSTSYVPGNTITFAGGTFTTAAVATVITTKITSAGIAAAGTGGTPGAVVLTGTTGTGTKFQINGTIASDGTLGGLSSVVTAGSYTVNPSSLTAEPVTGGGLTGATLNVVMGVNTANITTPGRYTVLPANPVAQGSSSGPGANFSANLTYGVDIVTVTNGGVDFVSAPAVSFTGGSGSGAAATAVLATVGDPVTVNFVFSDVLPTANFVVTASANQACSLSATNKATTGFSVTLTPLTSAALGTGLIDVNVKYIA